MKVVAVSDTLGRLPKVAECDLFIHAGNFAPIIGKEEYQSEVDKQLAWAEEYFCPWFKTIKAKHKVFISGQNDFASQSFSRDMERHFGAIYLQDEAATIDKYVVYGMPWFPPVASQYIDSILEPAFISHTQRHFSAVCERIPDETNLLVTRIPPKGILDRRDIRRVGDSLLHERIESLKHLKAHVFGFANNSSVPMTKKSNVLYVNAHSKTVDNSMTTVEFDI